MPARRAVLIQSMQAIREEMRTAIIVWVLVATPVVVAQRSLSGSSETCGPISGHNPQDLANVRAFCDTLPSETVVGAYATNAALWISVERPMADRIRTDPEDTERLVLAWMTEWKRVSGASSVVVTVRWGDIRVAKGETTRRDGDQVTVP